MMGTLSFQDQLSRGAAEVEAAIEALLPMPDTPPSPIHQAMRYSALGGGKRLRGILVIETARLVGAQDTWREFDQTPKGVCLSAEWMAQVGAVRATAAAVEMLHAYSLIHDDLPCMDDDDMRRGKPTNHRVYGEGIAVLAGDALLTRAFEVLGRLEWAGLDATASAALVSELAVAAGTGGLIGGQVVDLESEGRLSADAADAGGAGSALERPADLLKYIHTHKTGALFAACLRMGGFLGGVESSTLERLTEYARGFGMAFQIVDDLLDVEGDEATLGKQVGSDERRGKLTFPALYGADRARSMAREHIEAAKESLSEFGERGAFLCNLADFVLHREH